MVNKNIFILKNRFYIILLIFFFVFFFHVLLTLRNITVPEIDKSKVRLFPKQLLSPIFLDEFRRTFGNPVSYLGGPRLAAKPRTSIESVYSLD